MYLHSLGQAIAAGVIYASCVFAAGFLLGTVRILYISPRLGKRYAELLEMPFMHIVIVKAAQYTVHNFQLEADSSTRLLTGLVGVSLLLGLELLLNVIVMGKSGRQFWEERNPVSGLAYFGMLVLFGLMPFIHYIR